MDLSLTDRSVLVTGGSRGIGREIALHFAREGARVSICARNESALMATAAEIRAATAAPSVTIQADLSEPNECERVVATTVAAFGGLDILINNAGGNVDNLPSTLIESSDGDILQRVSGKALAAIRCSRAALPHLSKSGSGRIVFIAGTSARMVMRGRERPSTSGNPIVAGLGNAMIANFAKMLGEQAIGEGILINVVHPHIVQTDRHPARMSRRAAEMSVSEAEAEADLASYIPINRVTVPSDISPLVLLLASPLNRAITGQAIAIDGGAARGICY